MNILLTGASGFIGRHAQARLSAQGHRVIALSRHHGGDFRQMTRPADWHPWLTGIDAVINCVGILGESRGQRFEILHHRAPLALFQACAGQGIRRVIQISALGADASAFSAYHLSKRAADTALQALDVDWLVLRPSLIYGPGGGSAEILLRLARLPRLPVIGDGEQMLQPVHISDVCAAIEHALHSRASRQSIDIVGEDRVSFADWLRRLRAAQGLPPAALLKIPPRLALLAARAAGQLHPLCQPDTLRMLLRGYRADPAPCRHWLGRELLAYAPAQLFSSQGNL